MSSYKLTLVSALALNTTVNWTAKLASDKLQRSTVLFLYLIHRKSQPHGDWQNPRHTQNHSIHSDHDFLTALFITNQFLPNKTLI